MDFSNLCEKFTSVWLTTGLLCCGVGLIRPSGTVRFAITHFAKWYTHGRAGASPLTRVTVPGVTLWKAPEKLEIILWIRHISSCSFLGEKFFFIYFIVFSIIFNETAQLYQRGSCLGSVLKELFIPFHNIGPPVRMSFLTASSLVTVVSAVVELVAHPVLRNTATAGTCELTAATGLVD